MSLSRTVRLWIGVIAAALIATVAIYATGSVQRLTASWRGETDAIERTDADGAFRIGTYERFFDLCQSVQSHESQIAALEEELATDPPPARATVINSSLTGVCAARATAIHEYNSQARQEHRAAFRDAGLPERLDRDAEETTCTTE